MSRRFASTTAVAATAASLFLAAGGASSAHATPATPTPNTPPPQAEKPQADPALFQVGTSVVDITPSTPMAEGGYGRDYIVTGGAHDPLQVRAFFVGHGKQAVVLESVDSQGWFAAYQSPNTGDGADAARTDAAAALAARGYNVTAANIVLSTTHGHATPTLMGLWGHTDPAYLHAVKEAAVQAVLQAESNARPAELWSATGTIKGLVSQLQGTDQTAGFSVDTQLPILWAREPGTGATIGMYADVPVHADQYDPTAAGNNQYSADYPGYVRDHLGQLFGGTEVIGVGTIGRQESIGSDPSYAEVEEQGHFITNAITRALTQARRITDTTLAADNVPFTTQATNGGLLAAMSCNHPNGPLGCPGPLSEPTSNNGQGTWDWSAVGHIFTINRSLNAPYFNAADGNPAHFTVGSSATVARVGDQVYATSPGEGFPEVTEAIERAFAASPGIQAAHVINEGSDTLGYFGDMAGYPSNQLEGDLTTNNVGPNVGQDNLNAVVQAGNDLGLSPTPEQVTANITNPQAWSQPGVQFYPDQVQTDDPTVSLYGSAHPADPASGSASKTIGSSATSQNDGKISWDFGDGTTGTQPISARFSHTFPGPGLYQVKASVTDNLGNTYNWTQPVQIDPPLTAAVAQDPERGNTIVLTAQANGGAGNAVAAHWTFANGTTADGTTITSPHKQMDGSVTITDGAGNTATTTLHIN
jgi:PKD domain